MLYEKGGRKFGFLSLSPLGCLPALRALNPKASDGGCFEEACALALAHNNALSAVLTNLGHLLGGFKYSNSKFYSWLHDRINHPSKYGMRAGLSPKNKVLSYFKFTSTNTYNELVIINCS